MDIGTRMTQLVLTEREYEDVRSVAHMVHNAWPMETNRPVLALEAQFQAMFNLINPSTAAAMSPRRQPGTRVKLHRCHLSPWSDDARFKAVMCL